MTKTTKYFKTCSDCPLFFEFESEYDGKMMQNGGCPLLNHYEWLENFDPEEEKMIGCGAFKVIIFEH